LSQQNDVQSADEKAASDDEMKAWLGSG